ncbi:bone marrow proteoglycan-like isoform X2 [Ranitomeya variabilis]|uniref:bone marrow proteoglycan-like isoform X2 n=1 Tax=Ranitomeya variabilis TaxID=490064 RepID=UPI004057A70D
MWKLLLLLLVGTACAQESGDYEQENDDQLIKVATNEDNIHELLDEDNDEDELDEDFTEKAENEACPHNGTCHQYHVFTQLHCFNKAKEICRCRRGNLSSTHSCTANSNLQQYLKINARNFSYVWIGVWKNTLCDPYSTVDGSKLNYANWACNQNKTSGRWCVAMCVNTGKWYSFGCNKRLPFVCTY